MSTFHLATATFKGVKEEPVSLDTVFNCVKVQFESWCAPFRAYLLKSSDG
jgi:hypothetical protein